MRDVIEIHLPQNKSTPVVKVSLEFVTETHHQGEVALKAMLLKKVRIGIYQSLLLRRFNKFYLFKKHLLKKN